MRVARQYRYAAFVVVFVWIAALVVFKHFGNFSVDAPWRKWSPSQQALVCSVDVEQANLTKQANLTETAHPEKLAWIHLLPGVVSLKPPHLARVVYGGDTWLFECQSAAKETITETVKPTQTSTTASSPSPSGFLAEGIPIPFADRDGSESSEIAYLEYLISGLALNNTIIISPTNTAFLQLALSFNCRNRILGINNVLYWALDHTAAQILQEYRMPYYYNPKFTSVETFEEYHTAKYLEMMSYRPHFWRMVMKTGFDMLFIDVDTIVLKNPLYDIIGDADLEVQADEGTPTAALDLHHNPQMCAGALFLKSNSRSLKFLDRMERVLFAGRENIVDDQQALNFVVHDQNYARFINRFEKAGNNTPIGGYAAGPGDDRISVRVVPVDTFMSGHVWIDHVKTDFEKGMRMTLMNDQTGQVMKVLDMSLIHFNGIGHKEDVMKKFRLWILNDDLTCPLSN